MSTVKIDDQFNLIRGGSNEMGFIQNYCKRCNWYGAMHYAYSSYRHSNCQEEKERHRKQCVGENTE